MDKRKEELERKKQKLAELRKAREERKTVGSDIGRRADLSDTSFVSTASSRSDKQELDDLINSLVGRESNADRGMGSKSTSVISINSATNAESKSTDSRAMLASLEKYMSVPEKYKPTLTAEEFVFFDVAPKQPVMYSKDVQTDEAIIDEASPEDDEKPLPAQTTTEVVDNEPRTVEQAEEEPPIAVTEMSEDERKLVLQSEPFINFFDRSSKLVERALNDKFDILKDYTASGDDGGDTTSSKGMKMLCSFYDDRWSKNRSVTGTAWSPKYSELVLASYNKNLLAVNEPDGLVLVWNLHVPDRPEFVFHSQSDVMTAIFSEFHPNLVIGGTYSGQILIWDTRAKNLPVLKTPLSASGHTHPVFSMTMLGTQNANNIISASTDGLVCSWQVDMLAQPQEMLELLHASHPKTDEISVTTFGFPSNETATFWVGTEEGNIYQANRYDRAGSKAGINPFDNYVGHYGMITGMDFHPQGGFSDLFLTSSVDWTVKLWRVKSLTKSSTSLSQITPLYSFEESDDYVYDVKWSPVNPAVFGCVDGSGRFDVFHINQETEVPVVSTVVGSGKGLNKLQWAKDGTKAAIGSSDGVLYVYDVGEIVKPNTDDASLFQKTISEFASSHGPID